MPEKTKIHLKTQQPQSLTHSMDQVSNQQHIPGKAPTISNANKNEMNEALPSSTKNKRVKDVKSNNAKVFLEKLWYI